MDAKGNGNSPGLRGGVLSFNRETSNGENVMFGRKLEQRGYVFFTSIYVHFYSIIKEKLTYTATISILETKRLKY